LRQRKLQEAFALRKISDVLNVQLACLSSPPQDCKFRCETSIEVRAACGKPLPKDQTRA